ncbi:MAG: nucleotidyltransferase [Clostridia bacterium]|nr:nucleotidyltransferase [Clostridia bacterium]
MDKQPILVVMAAGIGSRFGGVKQLASFGKKGECIIDYSLYDAYRAGFRRVIFIVNEAIQEDFRQKIGIHAEKCMETRYVIQRLDNLPAGCSVPEGRVKPWGTGHAVLCCKELIDAPFAAINGDDFYGQDAFSKIYGFLSQPHSAGQYAMAGFLLKNTLSENGYVSRGVCATDKNSLLTGIVERTHIISTCDGPLYTEDGTHYTRLKDDTPVSMNLWGFTPDFMHELDSRFSAFYADAMRNNPLKGEYFLPFVVNDTLREGLSTVQVLHTDSKWFGVTYHDDIPLVQSAIRRMTETGEYPEALWD